MLKSIPKDIKIRLLVSLIIVILLALILANGCAFTHRGETSIGVLKNVERSGEETSRVLISRPARD